MRQIILELEGLRRRGRLYLVLQRGAVTAACVLAVTLGLVVADYLLRLPSGARLFLLAAGLVVLAYALWAFLLPAVLFSPGLVQLALRAEGVIPAVAGRLASSVEFSASGLDAANPLAARSVQDTESRLAGESLRRVLTGRRTWRDLLALVVMAGLVGSIALAAPAAARTGLARLLVPYGGAQWPARTAVVSLMDQVVPNGVFPRGKLLPLRARVTRGEPDSVIARYRLRSTGAPGEWQRVDLTEQADGAHERLIDTDAETIVFYFETQDARTPTERIDLVEPPAVQRAVLATEPPAYAAPWVRPLSLDLGSGLDERAVGSAASLAGSSATLTLELNKPLPVPGPEQLREVLGWGEGELPALSVGGDAGEVWTLTWRLDRTRSLNLQLADEYGLGNTEPIAYLIPASEDRAPAVTIIEPPADDAVLPTAVVPLESEARDDVAVARVGIEATRVRGDSAGEPQEPMWEAWRETPAPAQTLEAELALGEHELAEGDVVLLRGVAEDVFEIDGLRHEPSWSPLRRLRIISETDLGVMIRADLSAVRQGAIRIEAVQAELQDDIVARSVQPGIERAQARIGERIAAQREAVDRLAARISTNRLQDEQIQDLVGQVGDLLDFAGRASGRAVHEIEERQAAVREQGAGAPRRPEPAPPRADAAQPGEVDAAAREQPASGAAGEAAPPEPGEEPEEAEGAAEADEDFAPVEVREPAEEDRPIVEAQQEVREELADLINLLDRDEDAWEVERWLEKLMEGQARLEAETTELGRRTVGRDLEELAQEELGELRRIAERQSDLAEQARQIMEDLRKRAEDLRDVDPAASEALRQAAETGERREMTREMDNATERLGQNQMRNAQQSQQAARAALERMLQEIRDTDRANVRELVRRLASLIESVRRLVTMQENELAALAEAQAGAVFAGRDRSMIRLNQNTQAVADEARTAGQEARRVARVLDRAADAQSAAVVALRAEPVAAGQAEEAETRSLELLNEALALAEELAREVEERNLLEQREEIVAQYRRYLEQELGLRNETLELASEVPLDRRGLVRARSLARSQEEIRTGLDEVRAATAEVGESLVFRHVHDSIDDWARGVAAELDRGEVSVPVTDRQQRIADSIGRLIDALELALQPPSEFEGQSAGGAGGSSRGRQPLIPPIVELRLLRGMQEQVYDLTRETDARADLDAADREARLRDLGRTQRELLDLGRRIAEALREQAPEGAEPSEGGPS